MTRAGINPEQRAAREVGSCVERSYGRLLAALAARTGDIAAAEDALSDALERALRRWPDDGVPANPEGWVFTVARNRLRDRWKSPAYRLSAPLTELAAEFEGDPGPADSPTTRPTALPDRRLELMLVCAHPAIAANVRTPLMLQTVLGLDAAAIATAFAVPEATMAQRLVRAKRRIKEARIPFAAPEQAELRQRLPAVLEAIYGGYAVDWQFATEGPAIESLSAEALHLAIQLAEVLPEEAEVLGLAALLCFVESRRDARRVAGAFVPLDEQDTTRWDRALLTRAEELLTSAHRLGQPGRFQYEAAIQSAHCVRPVNWHVLRKLHLALLRTAPSLGTRVALATVEAEIGGPATGLSTLDAITDPAVQRFQPAWAVRGHLLWQLGDHAGAADAFGQAMRLTTDAGVRQYLATRIMRCGPAPT